MFGKSREIVVNWHITEACNYKCDYCFAKWDKNSKEILHSQYKTENLLKQIQKIQYILNKISLKVQFNQIRLNLVGGETFLYKDALKEIVKLSKKYNFKVSAITNGSLFDEEIIQLISDNFCSIGISVDSINLETNKNIGRSTNKESFNFEKTLQAISQIRIRNPTIDIKINTVVNSLNYNEDFSLFIQSAMPNKWKIFKLLPIYSKSLEISENEFISFLQRHESFKQVISAENNDTMIESYLMIDPLGRIFQNGINHGYIYSPSLCDVDIESAFDFINFDLHKFIDRYKRII